MNAGRITPFSCIGNLSYFRGLLLIRNIIKLIMQFSVNDSMTKEVYNWRVT